MKKIYALLSAALIGGAVASAQVEIGSTSYSTIQDAVNAAAEGDVITITEDITVNAMIDFRDRATNLTIESENGATVSCLLKNKLGFLIAGGKHVAFKNLNFIYTDDPSNATLFESSGWSELTFENCTISDFNTSNTQGVISVKNGGVIKASNLTFTGNTVPDKCGEVFLGVSGSTFSGSTNGSITLERNNSLSVADNFAPSSVVKIYLTGARDMGSNIVLGTEDRSNFELVSDEFDMGVSNGNIVAAEEGSYTAISAIEADNEEATAQYFNIQGMSVSADNLTPGLYIRRQGAKTVKILVK